MINVIGQFFGTSGYAKHTRYLVNELDKLEDVKILTNLPNGWERAVNDAELKMIKRGAEESYDTNLIITHPAHWRGNAWAKKNIVYLVWEGDSVPLWIMKECFNENIHKIIVPSQHTYDALLNTLLDDVTTLDLTSKVVLIPHGVDLDLFKPLKILKKQDKTTFNKPFKFLAVKGFTNMEDRGGIQYLVKAFCEEFKQDENVELILKINPAYGIPNIPEMFKDLTSSAPIRIIANEVTDKQMNAIYNDCDVFVSPTRGEAFNIPCLEALACGKPVITTNFGGQTDFCSDTTGWLIDYGHLHGVEHDLEYEGVRWATPIISELREAMRDAHSGILPQVKERCIKKAKEYPWSRTAKEIYKLCK